MKRLPITPILLALVWLAALPGASAQNLPPSMAYPTTAIIRAPIDDSQKLLVTGNSLVPVNLQGMDLGRIPAATEIAIRRMAIPDVAGPVQATPVVTTNPTTRHTKLGRSAALLGLLAIAYLVTRSQPDHRVYGDISELRNFPKKRLAQREAHA